MNKKLLAACLLALSLVISAPAQRRRRAARLTNADGCDLIFTGKDRKPVKLREPGLSYTRNNGGRSISVKDWFALICPFDVDVPARRQDIPQTEPMAMEKRTVKVKAFILAFKRDPDNDLHVQIGDVARPYRQTQMIVEVPPGAEYCEARTNIMNLRRADGGGGALSGNYVFRHPPLVEVTGYLFLDGAHITHGSSDYCTDNGGRGIKNGLTKSPVRGLWEIHPVLKLEKAS